MRSPWRSLVFLGAAALALAAGTVARASFTEVLPTGSPLFVTPAEEDFWINAVAPADYDLDGDLDLAVIGYYVVYNVSVEDRLVLFRNDGPGAGDEWSFTEVPVPLGTLWAGDSDLAWGDYDGDGDPDLAVASSGAGELYRNDAGTLVAAGIPLPAYTEQSDYTGAYDLRSLAWADTDNDGDLDLLVPSVYDETTFEFRTVLLRNDGPDGGGGWLFADAAATIDPTAHAQSAWADDDGDTDLDLFLVNVDPYSETGFVRRFRNDGGAFVGEDLLGIKVQYGLADWGDYDADGDLDILVAGNILETDGTYATVLRIYRNDGGGTYTPTAPSGAPDPPWLDIHAATWADYDSDGDVDLLATGNFVGATDIEGRSEVYGNTGGIFTPLGVNLPAPIQSIGRGGSFTWFDLDNDGDLDYLVAGAYYVPGGNGLVEAQIHIFRNDAPGTNAPPQAPRSPRATPSGNDVALAWSAPADDHTPDQALTYDLQVFASGQLVPSLRRLPEPGNLSAVTGWQLHGLPAGSYTWSVRAVDSAFNGGPAAEGAFEVGGGPSTPPGVSDGRDGTPLTVAKTGPNGSVLSVSYDVSTCGGAVDHHLVYGFAPQLPSGPAGTFSLGGSVCAIGNASPYPWMGSPDPFADPSGLVWFLLVASDAVSTEGSWGTDGTGAERIGPGAGGASDQCGMVARNLANPCGH